tara:strand:+ start:2601 stop:4265 length:1665 start_codon:yes stop_codon:yes gene_type:complete
MLQLLKIRGLALLKEVSLEFESGFTAVTGETGAGKSVLLGAFNLLAGGRVSKTIIREGDDECSVEGVLWFEDSKVVDGALEKLGLSPCEDGTLVLSRTVLRSRAPRIRINGNLATVGNLQVIGEQWIDFHGPGEPQKLLHERHQLALLDSFAKNKSLRLSYAEIYEAWLASIDELERIRSAEQLAPEEAEFLQIQIESIDLLELSAERVESLERDYLLVTNGQALREAGAALSSLLNGDDGVSGQISSGLGQARELASIDGQTLPLADRLESLLLEAEDLAQEYGALAEGSNFDEETATQVLGDMEAWLGLRRKYGGTVESVLSRRDELALKLGSQADIEGTVTRLETLIAEQEQALLEVGEKLRGSRLKTAKKLSKESLGLLKKLGFAKARFAIEVARLAKPVRSGTSSCQFTFAPNPGGELLPLGEIASSGEIARVMLALKAILAREDATPVLVFDEVDANVGGEVAAVVGRELAQLAEHGHQVFCITHLPQVAATGRAHFVVTKEQGDNYTNVIISRLDDSDDARLDELSRMLGDRRSESAREHARELLAR